VPQAVLDWLYPLATEASDRVSKSNATRAVEMAAADFLMPVVPATAPPNLAQATHVTAAPASAAATVAPSPRAAEPAAVAVTPAGSAPPPRQRAVRWYINKGATICADVQSMNKAIAIARANNPYIPTPDGCIIMQGSAPVTVGAESRLVPGTVLITSGDMAALANRGDLSLR
jgi:hypothetical protein